jgi:hypothetical protein
MDKHVYSQLQMKKCDNVLMEESFHYIYSLFMLLNHTPKTLYLQLSENISFIKPFLLFQCITWIICNQRAIQSGD